MAEFWCMWRTIILDIMAFVYPIFLFILQDHIENHFLFLLGVQAIKTHCEILKSSHKREPMPKTYREYNKEVTLA